MRFSLLLAITSLIVISSALASCGMKRALYLPEKREQQAEDVSK